MAIRFDSLLLAQDLAKVCKKRRVTLNKVAERIGVNVGTLTRMQSGLIVDITVHTLARVLNFMDTTDIEKYIYDDGEV